MRQLNRAVVLSIFTLVQACSDSDSDDDEGVDMNTANVGDSGVQRDGAVGIDAGSGSSLDAGPSADAATDARVDRSRLSNVGTDGGLDYTDQALWACRPDQGNLSECRANLDATEILKDGTRKYVPHVPAEDPKFDCFYIYPTVATSGGGNMTNFADIRPVLDPLLSQGARFNRLCEVYAPLYRQISLSTTPDGGVDRQGDGELAVNDVLAAFDEYMKTWNKGRNFVIVGHSQGTSMATELLKRKIDNDPELRKRFISAAVLGGAPMVPAGERVGASFKNIPTCTAPGETGCLLAYVTYAKEKPPAGADRFGKAVGTNRVVCTEPAKLAGNSGNYAGSYFRSSTNNSAFKMEGFFPSDLGTPFMLYRDYFKGECVESGDYNYLQVAINKTPDDKREAPPYRNPRLEGTGWGLHLVDWNLPLEDILTAVEQQAQAKLSAK